MFALNMSTSIHQTQVSVAGKSGDVEGLTFFWRCSLQEHNEKCPENVRPDQFYNFIKSHFFQLLK